MILFSDFLGALYPLYAKKSLQGASEMKQLPDTAAPGIGP